MVTINTGQAGNIIKTFLGSITIIGISDSDLAMLLEYKVKKATFQFAPNTLQQMPGTNPVKYSNCILSWNSEEGMKDARIILHKILHGHDQDPS